MSGRPASRRGARGARPARWAWPALQTFLASIVATVVLLVVAAGAAFAATPSPTTAAGGDPRSSGQGPGLVGDPLAAILAVAILARASLAATLLYVRLTGGPKDTRPGH